MLEAYSWPGNVREMGNVIEHLTQLSRGREITVEDLPAKIQADVLKKALRRPEAGEDAPGTDRGLALRWRSWSAATSRCC